MFAWLIGLAAAQDGVVDRVAAVVDDEVVALSEIYELGGEFIGSTCTQPFGQAACVYEAELEILDSLVKRALMKRALEQLNLRVSNEEIDQAIDSIVRDYNMPDRESLRNEVENSGLRWDAYRQQIREQLQIQRFQQRILAPRVTVSPDEVEDLYKRTARGETSEAIELDALGIILPPEEEAQGAVVEQAGLLVKALNAGEQEWEKALELYDGAGVNEALGSRPYKKGELTPQLDEALFAEGVEDNVFLEPIAVGNVLMIARVTKRESVNGEVKPFEEVELALQNQIMTDKVAEAEEEWYQRTRREASVEVLLPSPE